jgi:hypothetical protein
MSQDLWDDSSAPLRENYVSDVRLVLKIDNYLEKVIEAFISCLKK